MKQKIEVRIFGEPTTDGLSEYERVAFYTALYARMQQLSQSNK